MFKVSNKQNRTKQNRTKGLILGAKPNVFLPQLSPKKKKDFVVSLKYKRERERERERESMKFAVKAWSNGSARAGVVQLGNFPHPIETPCLLLSTRKGLPFFISPDLLPSLPSPDSHLLQVCPLHLYVFTTPPQFLCIKKLPLRC